MKTLARVLLIVLLLFVCSGHTQAQDILGNWDRYLDAQEEVNHLMGSVLVAQKGKLLLRKSFGMADVEHDVPNTPQTKFRIGSLTKQFTAAAVLLLQERGLLDVHDPIGKYIEDAPESWAGITIHHLLRHTSGVPNFTDFPDYLDTWTLPSRPDKTILRLRDKPLDFAPGTKFAYSNSGYIMLALIIENASGMSYGEFLRQNVFDPIGMKDSGHDDSAAILKHRASGYIWGENGLEHAPYCDMDLPTGGGDIYSTVDDMNKWDRALYTNSLLSDQSREAMFTKGEAGYAYGWGIGDLFGSVHCHAGGINGFAAQIIRYPERDIFVIILCNQENSPVVQIGRDLMAIFFGQNYELPKHED
jgi:CubicO group peptidase (beta-lactamase class C family)